MGQDTRDDDIVGFNTEVSYRRQSFHVQTEALLDESAPLIHTLVFHSGALLEKVATSHPDLTAEEVDHDELRERVRRQHHDVLARVKSGAIGGRR